MKELQVCLDVDVLPSQGDSKGSMSSVVPQARRSCMFILVYHVSIFISYVLLDLSKCGKH